MCWELETKFLLAETSSASTATSTAVTSATLMSRVEKYIKHIVDVPIFKSMAMSVPVSDIRTNVELSFLLRIRKDSVCLTQIFKFGFCCVLIINSLIFIFEEVKLAPLIHWYTHLDDIAVQVSYKPF